jgi:Phosphotransferase enzyme family
MVFLLGTQNVFQYLVEQGLCDPKNQDSIEIVPKICKNFNLLIRFPDVSGSESCLRLQTSRRCRCPLLIKQEPHDTEGNTKGELWNEWRVHEFIQRTPELNPILPFLSEAIHFDHKHSIIVFNYLDHYCDLEDFYNVEHRFPTDIAAALGATLATVHRATIDRQDYHKFLLGNGDDQEAIAAEKMENIPNFTRRLEQITPKVFGTVPADGLKFYELYQRYESFGQAIAELNTAFKPCCLTHNDLKLSNVLLHTQWESLLSTAARCPLDSRLPRENEMDSVVRLIDWEKWSWGDPLLDLGTLIASYLKIWLKSLIVSSDIEIEIALRLALMPLEQLQPSIVALTQSYLTYFPEILEHRPDFWQRLMQFTGLALIQSIQTRLQYRDPFGNIGICMLQVAKSLLCTPEQSIPIVFGIPAIPFTDLRPVPA